MTHLSRVAEARSMVRFAVGSRVVNYADEGFAVFTWMSFIPVFCHLINKFAIFRLFLHFVVVSLCQSNSLDVIKDGQRETEIEGIENESLNNEKALYSFIASTVF
jgi:hypothetical protein